MGRLLNGRGHWVVLGAVIVVFGGLVWAAFGRNHTKVVTQTKTVTQTVARPVASTWDRTAQSLANYLRPQQAQQVPCGRGAPAGEKCFVFVFGQNYIVTLAQPS